MVRHTARILTALSLVLVAILPATAAPAPFAYEDVNCDGTYTPGIDIAFSVGVPGYPPAELFIDTVNCLVIPRGSISGKAWASLHVFSQEGTVILGASLLANGEDDTFIKGDAGMTVLPGTVITSRGGQYIGSNRGPFTIGQGAHFTSQISYAHLVHYDVGGSDFTLGSGVVVRACDEINLFTWGHLNGSGLNALTTCDFGSFFASGYEGLTLNGSTLKAGAVIVGSDNAGPVVFRNNRVRNLVDDFDSQFVGIYSIQQTPEGPVPGPVDVTGTLFLDVERDVNLFISGDPIVGAGR
jgi:hypothetical protein